MFRHESLGQVRNQQTTSYYRQDCSPLTAFRFSEQVLLTQIIVFSKPVIVLLQMLGLVQDIFFVFLAIKTAMTHLLVRTFQLNRLSMAEEEQ